MQERGCTSKAVYLSRREAKRLVRNGAPRIWPGDLARGNRLRLRLGDAARQEDGPDRDEYP
jgi:hypothetical protein